MNNWIVINAEKNELFCKRCGATQKYLLPMSLDIFLAFGKAFVKQHKGCKDE
jgi:hypothetical protein